MPSGVCNLRLLKCHLKYGNLCLELPAANCCCCIYDCCSCCCSCCSCCCRLTACLGKFTAYSIHPFPGPRAPLPYYPLAYCPANRLIEFHECVECIMRSALSTTPSPQLTTTHRPHLSNSPAVTLLLRLISSQFVQRNDNKRSC